MKEERFLSLAKKASKKSDHHSHRLGCVLVRGSKVIGVGFNLMKTHTYSTHKFKNIHAEFMALVASGYDIKGATAYIYREQKDGTPATSRPCEACYRMLVENGIKRIVYTFDGSFKEEKV